LAKTLIVGDVHATPQELGDCEALLKLVIDSVEKYKVDLVVFLGDQYNNHNILDCRVLNFWTEVFNSIRASVVCLLGNHDQVSPTCRFPHSMVAHRDISECLTVVDFAKGIIGTKFCAMPYYYDPVEFIKDANELKQNCPDCNLLFCHQTFVGADQGLGFYAQDAVEASAIPFKIIVSGHIHKPMKLGKVWYPGSPRWRTLADAEVEQRAIYILEPGKPPVAISTNNHCTRIYRLEDSETNPVKITLSEPELAHADIRISITGTVDYISKRMTELKNKYNAKCRGVPTRSRLVKVSESEGIENAFQRYCGNFVPPNNTDKNLLLKEVYARIQDIK
jgi:DNA repair exonuclease SbcCD nuclease subunit